MTPDEAPVDLTCERRVQAVLALFRGEPVTRVSTQYRVCRRDLYKFHRRALAAIRQALADHRRGPRQPHNRLAADQEAAVVSLCERYPTWSSYQIYQRVGAHPPSPRTIQRIRERRGLARLPKRAPPRTPARRIPEPVRKRVRHILRLRPHLGPERVRWDVQNGEHLTISTSTVKRLKRKIHDALHPAPPPPSPPVWRFYERHHPHSLWHGDYMKKIKLADGSGQTAFQLTFQDDYSRGYVFCELSLKDDVYTTVKGMIAAMRQWQVIPKAVLFDNGSHFRGKLLWVFCKNLGIRVIYSSVNHPQTNGKPERAFQDDMRDFYQQYHEWLLDHLRHDLPSYVHYRNYIRGHRALGGKPSIARLQEHTEIAPAHILDQLESYASYGMGRQVVRRDGSIRVLGRSAQLDVRASGQPVTMYETMRGMEVKTQDGYWYLFPDYRLFRQLKFTAPWDMPASFAFERQQGYYCARIAVAQ
jgi:transposase InsO family protein